MLPVHHKAQPQRKGNTVYLFLLVLLSVGLVVEFGYWRKQIARLVVLNEELRSNAAELRAQNDKLSSSVADQKDALHSAMKEKSQLEWEARTAQDSAHRHEEEEKAAKDALAQGDAKVKELQGQVDELHNQMDGCIKESADHLKKVADITNQLEECSSSLTLKTEEVERLAASPSPVAGEKNSPVEDTHAQPATKNTDATTDPSLHVHTPVAAKNATTVAKAPTQVAPKNSTAEVDARTKVVDSATVANPQEIKDASTGNQGDTTPGTPANDGGSVDPTDLVAPDENKSQNDEENGSISKGTVSRSKATFNPDEESNDAQEEIKTVGEA